MGVDYKAEAEATIIRDVDLGELLAVDYTPEQEKRVVRKLDFAYAPPSLPRFVATIEY
jgi:hypothetical protein